jgi:hypothetical protein
MSSPKKKDLLAAGLTRLRARSGEESRGGGFMQALAEEIANKPALTEGEKKKAKASSAPKQVKENRVPAKPLRDAASAFQFATIVREKPQQIDWLTLKRMSKGARRILQFLSSQRLGPGEEPQFLPPQVLKLGLGVKAANTTPPLCLPTLAQQVGLKERAVQYCIDKLTQVGAVRRIGWSQNAREYGQRGMIYEICLSTSEVAECIR